jgi:hypothetical protein
MFRQLLHIAVLALAIATAPAGDIADSALSPNAQVYTCAPGPWGNVEWHFIHLEAPDWIVAEYPMPSTQPAWRFPDWTVEKVGTFLRSTGLDESTVNGLLTDKRAIRKGSESTTLFPSVAVVEGLSPSTRGAVYAELAKWPQNEFYFEPFYIRDNTVDDWLGPTPVRPEIRDIFEHLTYKRGDVLAFSDMSVLMGAAKDSNEALRLMKLCTRVRAIMAYLRVDAGSDISALEKYWSAGYRRKDVRPMLESVSQLPGGGRLGFAHLLPAEARKLIYSYPTLDLAGNGQLPNCHWTTLNFFNFRPQNVFLDLRIATSRVLQGYTKVDPPYAFGDALFYLNKEGDAIHSCVYLCDDLVYTKNGDALSTPWTISRIGTLMRLYSPAGASVVHGFRRSWDTQR